MKKDRTTHLAAMLEAGAPSEKIRKVVWPELLFVFFELLFFFFSFEPRVE